MRKSKTRAVTLFLFIIICVFSLTFTAYAQAAVKGDTLTVTISVFNQPDLTGLSDKIEYDTDYLELLGYTAPLGMSQCNDTVDGELYLSNVFDPINGMDFTEKTVVLELVFAVKSNFGNAEELVSQTITEALDSNLTEINHDTVIMDFSVTPGGADVYKPNVEDVPTDDDEGQQTKPSGASSIVVTPYAGSSESRTSGSKTSSADSRTKSSSEHETSTGNSLNENTSGDTSIDAESYLSEKVADNKNDEEKLVSQQNAFKESGDMPTPYSTDAHKRYMTAFIIGGVMLAVAAVVFIIMVYKAKKKPSRH